jgi:hypothetical protein
MKVPISEQCDNSREIWITRSGNGLEVSCGFADGDGLWINSGAMSNEKLYVTRCSIGQSELREILAVLPRVVVVEIPQSSGFAVA